MFGRDWMRHQKPLSTLYRKLSEFAEGKTIEYLGQRYNPLYTPRNVTLIRILDISETEQRQLHTIISPELARERHAQREASRRREAGAVTRAEYEQTRQTLASSKAEQAKALREQGLSAVKIAETMGIGLRTVKLYLSNHN
ncbi:MAG: hypothetical protein ACRCYV_06785 [Aeromonas sp.]